MLLACTCELLSDIFLKISAEGMKSIEGSESICVAEDIVAQITFWLQIYWYKTERFAFEPLLKNL